ncbi:MAG: T9SS type A sorting domain-containing protein [Saprospiraceae bacterium]|nr:T9SS type A sorting domain-containing protein [Saprospiraceae bacterium]
MKHCITLIIGISFVQLLSAQVNANHWKSVAPNQIFLPQAAEVQLPIENYQVFELDLKGLKRQLAQAPEEFSKTGDAEPLIQLPSPEGTLASFRAVHSPVMGAEISARYPSIRSFKIVHETDQRIQGRIDYSPKGFHAYINSPQGKIYIDPYANVSAKYHVVYYAKDVHIESGDMPALSCGVHDLEHSDSPLEDIDFEETNVIQKTNATELLSLRTYNLALACTGEYAQAKGGTVELVLATMNTAVNRVNLIFEQEVAIRLLIIDRNDELIFLDPATDPYLDARNGTQLLTQNTAIINARIGFGTYDIGHVFTRGCDNGLAGVANPSSVCQSNKGAGVTCHFTNDVERIAVDVMAHEIGHQFSCGHSWNNCPNSASQRSPENAFEPGSGSTIMSYAGLCGSNNVQPNADPYYNIGSLEDFIKFSREDGGNNCPTITETGNHLPTITDEYEDGFTIPINTPFRLSANAADEDGDMLTYCWEQFDTGPFGQLGSPTGDAPLFRSYPPVEDSTRYFPNLGALLNNATLDVEVLPAYSRFLTFRCTARDNNPEAGGIAWTEVAFKSSDTAGPFLVTAPNTTSDSWTAGSSAEVFWDVANTDNEIVNCQKVNIYLSTDGGLTYPTLLLAETANDGQAFVTVPDVTTTDARVMVAAANNIFFDISNRDFTIEAGQSPTFTLSIDPLASLNLCPPTDVSIQIDAFPTAGFSGPITLEVVGDLPANTTASFSQNPIDVNQSSQLELSLQDFSEGTFDFLIKAYSGTDTIYRDVRISTVSNDFSDLALMSPADGTRNIVLSTDFSWAASDNADTYGIEIATSPVFAPETIILQENDISGSTYSPSIQFDDNQLYFWRIKPRNVCGDGPFSAPFAFQTSTAACVEIMSTGDPVILPGSGLPTRELQINVPDGGTISDLNIPRIRGSFQPVNSLRFTVISPNNTAVVLFDQNCGNTTNIDIGFDSDAPLPIQCAPDDNLIFQPVESLDVFDGEDAQGDWTLKVEVVESGFGGGGRIEDWVLEYCASLNPSLPAVLTNDTLFVPPSQFNIITRSKLEIQDPDQSSLELAYTIITPPAYGNVLFDGVPLNVGDQFLQAHINDNRIVYEHDGTDIVFDQFTFIVEDGTGGWLPTQAFQIKIDENAVVGTVDPIHTAQIRVFPNPADDQVQVVFEEPWEDRIQLDLVNLQGQVLHRQVGVPLSQNFQFDVRTYPAGVYFLQLRSGTATRSFKLVLQGE